LKKNRALFVVHVFTEPLFKSGFSDQTKAAMPAAVDLAADEPSKKAGLVLEKSWANEFRSPFVFLSMSTV